MTREIDPPLVECGQSHWNPTDKVIHRLCAQFLLIGPVWLPGFIYKRLGIVD